MVLSLLAFLLSHIDLLLLVIDFSLSPPPELWPGFKGVFAGKEQQNQGSNIEGEEYRATFEAFFQKSDWFFLQLSVLQTQWWLENIHQNRFICTVIKKRIMFEIFELDQIIPSHSVLFVCRPFTTISEWFLTSFLGFIVSAVRRSCFNDEDIGLSLQRVSYILEKYAILNWKDKMSLKEYIEHLFL